MGIGVKELRLESPGNFFKSYKCPALTTDHVDQTYLEVSLGMLSFRNIQRSYFSSNDLIKLRKNMKYT